MITEQINQQTSNKVIFASQTAAKLDSSGINGGGTNDTQALQDALDLAKEYGGITLIMDGAALVRGLTLHSNTTIECLNKDCGFFLADYSNCAVVTNVTWDFKELNHYRLEAGRLKSDWKSPKDC